MEAAIDTYSAAVQAADDLLAEEAAIRDLLKQIADLIYDLCENDANWKFFVCYPDGCGIGG